MKNQYSDAMYCAYCVNGVHHFYNEIALCRRFGVQLKFKPFIDRFYRDYIVARTEEVTQLLQFAIRYFQKSGITSSINPFSGKTEDYFEWREEMNRKFHENFIEITDMSILCYEFGRLVGTASGYIDMMRAALIITADSNRDLDLTVDIPAFIETVQKTVVDMNVLTSMLSEHVSEEVISAVSAGIEIVVLFIEKSEYLTENQDQLKKIALHQAVLFENIQGLFGKVLKTVSLLS